MPKYKSAPEQPAGGSAAAAVPGLQYSMAGGLQPAVGSAVSGGMVMMAPHMAMSMAGAAGQPAVSTGMMDAASQLQMLQQQQLHQLQRPGLMPGMGLQAMQQIAMPPAVSGVTMGMPAMAGVPGFPGLVTQPQVRIKQSSPKFKSYLRHLDEII